MEDKNINPHDLEAEQQILGAIVIDNGLIRKIDITTDDFYSQNHQEIFKAMLKLDADGMPIDASSLRNAGIPEIGYITRIALDMITTANIKYHSDLVQEMSRKRKLRKVCIETLNNLNEESIDDLLSVIRGKIVELLGNRANSIVTSKDMAKEMMLFIERRYNNAGELSGITSGFKELDSMTDGFQPGEATIIAGRPGTGKSAFAMACASNAKVPVGVISLEMGSHQIGIRQISTLSGLELWKLRKGMLKGDDWPAILEALKSMSAMPIYFSFSSYKTSAIERVITQMIEMYGCKMIIVDYLQLTKGNEAKKREQEVAEVSRTLKLNAMSNNIPVIVLSQLNREVEKRAQAKPMLSDLRESGSIEQDADVVIFLWCPDKKNSPNLIELSIAKGRNCGLGEVYLYAEFETMTFKPAQRPEGL